MTALNRPPVRFAAVAVAYFLASRLGTAFVVQPENLSVFWPAGGLLLGYLLATGRRRWPEAVAAAFAGNLAGNLTFGHTFAVSAGFAVVNALEPLATAWLIESARGGKFRLDRTPDVLLLFAAPLVACAVSALIGAALVTVGLGAPSYWGVWRVWWLADALGAILFAPLVLAFGPGRARRNWFAAAEFGLTLAALVGLTWAIFAIDLRQKYALLTMPYPVFPLLLWAALRFDLRGTAGAVVAVCLIATAGTLRGYGPFGQTSASPAAEVLVTQGFVATVCLSSLVLAVAMRERRRAEDDVRGQRQLLRTILDSMGEAVLVADTAGRVVLTNAAFDRLHADTPGGAGRPPGEWSKAFGVYLPDGTLCPPDRLPIFRAARGEACDDVRLVIVNGAHPDGVHISVTGRPVGGPAAGAGGVVTIRDVTPALRAEEAVRESEELLTRFFEAPGSLRGVVELIDDDIVHVRDNAAAAAFFGRSQDEMRNRRASALGVPPAAIREWIGHYRESARLGRTVQFEFAAAGADRWLMAAVAPLLARTGGERFAYVALDVTERKRAEAALVASEQRFRATFHSQFQFIGLMAPDGTLLEANRTALAAAGASEADVVGRPFWETAWWAHDAAQQERLKAAVQRAAGGGRDRFEASHPTADGGVMWVDFSLTPFRDPGGAVVLLIPEGRDITERKKIEAELRLSEERFRAFLDHLPLAAWAADAGGRLVLANRFLGAMLGRRPEDLVGKTRTELLPDPADARAHEEIDRRVLAEGRAVEEEEAYLQPDGGRRVTFSVKFPVRAADGTVVVGGVALDVTDRRRAESAVRESEERFRSAFDHAPIGMALVAPDGRWLRVNKSVCDLVGYTEAELLATDFQALTHPDDLAAGLDLVRQVLAGTAPTYQMEKRYSHKRGHVIHALLSVSLVRAADGAPLYFVAQIKDVTARKAADAAVRESEERYRVLFEQSSDAHLIFDEAGIIDCNNAAVAMLRCADKRQVLALHPAALSPEFQPDGRRSLEKCVEMDAIARRHGHHRFDWLHRRFDGDVFPCEVTLTPVELHGRPALLVVWHDLTERQRAEQARRDSEERFRAAMEGSLDAVYFLTAERGPGGAVLDFRFAELNRRGAGLVSRTREEVLGRRLCELLPVNRTAGFFDKYVRVVETGEPVEEEFAIAPADGLNAAWLRHQVVRVGDGVAITTQDITARKAAEDRVRASLREKEVLLKEIHHRVKNNLQIVSALLDLQSDHTADPGALEMFQESRGRVKSMALVHERLYRSEDVARVNFAEYARQLADDLSRAYRAPDGVRVEVDVDVPPLPIDVAIPCGLLLNELMSNCFKHAFKGGEGVLRVSLTGAAGANVLVVADDGVGFPAGIDFRNTASFGLQLVNTLVEQLGGSVELTAGRGTAFAVRFATN